MGNLGFWRLTHNLCLFWPFFYKFVSILNISQSLLHPSGSSWLVIFMLTSVLPLFLLQYWAIFGAIINSESKLYIVYLCFICIEFSLYICITYIDMLFMSCTVGWMLNNQCQRSRVRRGAYVLLTSWYLNSADIIRRPYLLQYMQGWRH